MFPYQKFTVLMYGLFRMSYLWDLLIFENIFFFFKTPVFEVLNPLNPQKLYFSEKNFDSAKDISNTDIISFIWAILKKTDF